MRPGPWLLLLAGLVACVPSRETPPVAAPAPRPAWALAIHAGAGTISPDVPAERREAYLASLRSALREGRDHLAAGGTALEAVERVVRLLEDDPLFNAGRGAVFTRDGGHELDASIMDGRDLSCGAVAGVTRVRHPIELARLVMTRTPHVLLAGPGADEFAAAQGVELVEPAWFDTPARREALERWRGTAGATSGGGTVGAVALDRDGNLAAATSTGALTGKMHGRVGDSPIIGAGTYADNRSCAVSGTGVGEEFIRHGVTRMIAARSGEDGRGLRDAVAEMIHGTLREGDGGVIALAATGEIVLDFNTPGMFRGAADANGRFDVGIWAELLPGED